MDSFDKRPKRKKMDLRFGTWNIRSMYRAGSLRTVVEEVSKYKLDLVGVQDVIRDRGGTESADQYREEIPLSSLILTVYPYTVKSYIFPRKHTEDIGCLKQMKSV
jgi:hypothetical protein